jgi:hypothetical protein
MKILTEYREFHQLVWPLSFEDFDNLGIVPSTKLGYFTRKRLPELLAFCAKHPKYHIIATISPDIMFNKVVCAPHVFYELGSGNPDPEIVFARKSCWDAYLGLRALEFETDKL